MEVLSDVYEEARDAILPFAELIKSPEYVHTYRITPLSLWNAAAMGITHDQVLTSLSQYTRYDIPQTVMHRIREAFDRWDAVRLFKAHGELHSS